MGASARGAIAFGKAARCGDAEEGRWLLCALRSAAHVHLGFGSQVTGCRNATFLDLHHLELRSEGGQNEPENLITICTVHHRAAHRGELVISGSATNVRFRHADGTEYGHAVVPQAVDALAKVFSALRGLGFREGQVRVVLAELRMQGDLRGASTERLLREALQRLAPPTVRPMRR